MDARARIAFALLILAQAAHSIEEYVFRLYDVLAPARIVSGVFSRDPARGFAIANMLLVAFGAWSYLARVRSNHPAARAFAWFWALLELANGMVHSLLAAARGGYFPGVWTAPVLIVVSGYVIVRLSSESRSAPD